MRILTTRDTQAMDVRGASLPGPTRTPLLAAVMLAIALAPAGASAGERGDLTRKISRKDAGDAAAPAGPAAGKRTPESVWKGFVAHLRAIGREDLLHRDAGAALSAEGRPVRSSARADDGAAGEAAEHEDGHEEHGDHAGHDHGGHGHAGRDDDAGIEPGRDPILPVLLELSPELARVQSLLGSGDELGATPAAGAPAIEKALAALEKTTDPYVREYARLYRARHELGAGRPRKAVAALEGLEESRHFLGDREAHRTRARAYLAAGDDTLALLELRFFELALADEDLSDRTWAEEQLAAIRKKDLEGPLHDSAEQARAASLLISTRLVGERTQEEQKRVEEILERAVRLLGGGAAGEPGGGGGGAGGRAGAGEVTLEGQRRVEKILDGVIKVIEKSSSSCSGSLTSECPICKKKTACKKCGACSTCGTAAGTGHGQGKPAGKKNGKNGKNGKGQLARDGKPRGPHESDTPAEDTRIRKGKPDDPFLRDPDQKSKELWGRINDRDVARSLRELWGKIPPAYRAAVAEYFIDITDLDDSADASGGKQAR